MLIFPMLAIGSFSLFSPTSFTALGFTTLDAVFVHALPLDPSALAAALFPHTAFSALPFTSLHVGFDHTLLLDPSALACTFFF
jgi:hypothetical protein